jgi:hypothetical protein
VFCVKLTSEEATLLWPPESEMMVFGAIGKKPL